MTENSVEVLNTEGIEKMGLTKKVIVKKGSVEEILKAEKDENGQPYFSHTSDFWEGMNNRIVRLLQDAKKRTIARGGKRMTKDDL